MDKVINLAQIKSAADAEATDPTPQPPSVLPADHPLLAKFQLALREHLLKVNAELQNDIDAHEAATAKLAIEQEECGARLYDALERIDRQKDSLDDYNTQLQAVSEKRQQHERNVAEQQQLFDADNRTYGELQRAHREHLQEVQHLQVLEHNIAKWTDEIEAEVKVAKRVVSKDGRDQLAVAEEKRRMDLLMFSLDAEVKRNERRLATVQEQQVEQKAVMDGLNQSITDANADVQALQNEHRRLIGSWNDVLRCIKQRDKRLTEQREAISAEAENHKLLDASIEGTRRSADREMELNGKLEALRQKIVNELEAVERQLEKETQESGRLQLKIDTMNRLVFETETNQAKANVEGSCVDGQLRTLRGRTERQLVQKLQLEEQTLAVLQEQISDDQATTYRGKALRDLQERRRNMELSMFGTEQQLSAAMLSMEEWKAAVATTKALVEKKMANQSGTTDRVNAVQREMSAANTTIVKKSKHHDTLNRQLMAIIDAAGGKEVNPVEIKMAALESENANLDAEIRETQSFWIQLQSHVVSLSEKRSDQFTAIQLARKQLLVVAQKSQKVELELDTLRKQGAETGRQLKLLYTKLESLNAQLCTQQRQHNVDATECQFAHQQIEGRLHDEELAALQLESDNRRQSEAIEEARMAAVERHREALSWETKWKMAAETHRMRANERDAASELGQMRAEIHRMEVRYGQLRRAQEKLAIDMQHCVWHRDHIHDSATRREKMPAGTATRTRYTIQHRLNDMRNKCRKARDEMAMLQRDVAEMECNEKQFRVEIGLLQRMVDDEERQGKMLEAEIEQKRGERQENLDRIVRLQMRARHYRQLLVSVGNGKALPKLPNEAKMLADGERCEEVGGQLQDVFEALAVQFPERAEAIERALGTMKME